jgi:hypothetical protein
MNTMNDARPTSVTNTSASQLKTIVALFIVLRLTLLLLYTPQGLLNAYTNFHFYYLIAQFSEVGRYPFVNMWYEYPPLSAYVPELAYRLTRAILPVGDFQSFTYQFYARLLGTLMLVFETGVLLLVHRIGAIAWGEVKADWLAWVYSALSVPLFYWNTSQDAILVFFTLWALYNFVTGRWRWSAIALGLGITAKFTPVFFLGPAFRWLWPRRRGLLIYGTLTVVTAAAVYGIFFALGGGPWVMASFVSLSHLASWATPWAILDNNWGPGNVGELTSRLYLDQAATPPGNPPVIPGWVSLIIFAAGYAWLFFRPLKREPRHFIWFTTLSIMVFCLWSKGWSPQWATLLLPLILLAFPDTRGVKLSLLLTAIVFVEWPLSDALRSTALLGVAILSRALLFIVIGWLAARQLWPAFPRTAPEDSELSYGAN